MPRVAEENLTVCGQETEFEGSLEFTDNLVISGKFQGTITSSSGGNLEIEKSAVCNVDKVTAGSVIVSGKLTGNIEASESLELCSGSKVKGDLKAGRIRISDGVEFEGKVTMTEKAPSSDIFSLVSDEYKSSLIMQQSEE